MNKKMAATVLLESALLNFEKFKTFLERAWETDESLYSKDVHEKVNYLHFFLKNSLENLRLENLKGGSWNEESIY